MSSERHEDRIRRALVTLPLDASLAEALDAITLTKPKDFEDEFDEEEWTDLANSARRRLKSSGRFSRPADQRGRPFVTLVNAAMACRMRPAPSPGYCVSCPECEIRGMTRQYPLSGGCLLCARTHDRWVNLWQGLNIWYVLGRAIEDRSGAEAKILADWFDENDWSELATWVRDNWPPAEAEEAKSKARE